ncbi:sesquipedalian-1-like isoform X2 [Thalassophryne amazonica]|uniref:sesquipedalian-1-like isoform X2 n=1 Tax=Thalassophryne amazonica TaxID=390379 RepID=UPI0014721FB3|nr:sesquipedalian-1-like isoform X2 [Thalassophryne amazonica]
MKIDEKILTHFESCNSPVDKEGYLYKKGERNTSYQKRWCVLKGNLLFYKDRPADRDLIGVIVLEGCTVQLCESEEQFAFALVWSEPGLRTYKFAAENQASQESWIKALLSANHSYLVLLVMDLQKQYREALATYSSDPASGFAMSNLGAAEGGYPAAHLSTHSSARSLYVTPGVGSEPSLNSSQLLQPTPVPAKPASKRSPKLRPKKVANVMPVTDSMMEQSLVASGAKEDFYKLHEDFGKEVKELIADWSKRAGGDDIVGNLIDFG